MSFTFEWPRFSDQFHADAIQMLNNALNKGNKPPVIADKIEVVELEMGSQPPELEIRDIGELTVDQFRGIFRLTYSGDAHIVLKTKVQANPLNHKQPDIHLMAGSRGMLAAKHPLVVPMLLRLSHFKLNSYVVLVVSKQKGITLVFKTDPLQNVDINSTFDSIAVIQKFIQREIEGQLRQMFREDLPGIIHRLSQQWVKAKVEAPYLINRPSRRKTFDTMSTPEIPYPSQGLSSVGLQPHLLRQRSLGPMSYGRAGSVSSVSATSTNRRTNATSKSLPSAPIPSATFETTSFPDLENFDPTYGLRPDGLPAKSLFSNFGRLFTPNKGLADLAEDPNEGDDYEEGGSFDVIEWEDTVPDATPSPTVSDRAEDATEYETIPAVGGGMITRPRVYHAQSMIQAPPDSKPDLSEYPSPRPGPSPTTPSSYLQRPDDEAIYVKERSDARRMSVSSHSDVFYSGSPPNRHHIPDPDPEIVLRPSLNNTIHQLSTLSHSNHTLSPYTRSLEHFTVRSIPPRGPRPSGLATPMERQPVKAKRKRTYRLGGQPTTSLHSASPPPSSPIPPSEFDASDMDLYFRSRDESLTHPPASYPIHILRQHSYQPLS